MLSSEIIKNTAALDRCPNWNELSVWLLQVAEARYPALQHADAADLCQIVCLRAFRRWKKNPAQNFRWRAYLGKALRNAYFNFCKRSRRIDDYPLEDIADATLDDDDDALSDAWLHGCLERVALVAPDSLARLMLLASKPRARGDTRKTGAETQRTFRDRRKIESIVEAMAKSAGVTLPFGRKNKKRRRSLDE